MGCTLKPKYFRGRSNFLPSDRLEFIKTEWSDIHHSRNQELKVFAALVGDFLLIKLDGDYKVLFYVLGALISLCGALISSRHNVIAMTKLAIIDEVERSIGIKYPADKSLLNSGLLITIIFVSISSALYFVAIDSLLAWISEMVVSRLAFYGVKAIALVLTLIYFCFWVMFFVYIRIKKRNKLQNPDG